jgi:5'-3' exonuclease
MGIPSYFSYIIQKYSSIIKPIHKCKINNFYLDCNSIIYDTIKNVDVSTLKDNISTIIISQVISKIEEYIYTINPDNVVYIAFDGVAPLAKLEQQRQRRFKSLYQEETLNTILKKDKCHLWNNCAITPGTTFMKQLNTMIESHFIEASKYNVNKLVLSLSNQYGEGEHKIFEYIRANPVDHHSLTTCIYGLDADLIMLCINHLHLCESIFLYRETPHFISNLNSSLEPNKSYLFDISILGDKIVDTMKHSRGITKSIYDYSHDYIFLCFMLGNDFLPHFPSVNIRTGGIFKLLNAYKNVMGSDECLTNGKKIYWKNVRKIIKHLADLEEFHIIEELKKRDNIRNQYNNNTPENTIKKFESLPLQNRMLENQLNPTTPGWKYRYYTLLFHIEPDEIRLKQICMNYLEGLEWTMKYYTTNCFDWKWKYKYHYPPLLCDLIKYTPYFETELIPYSNPSPVSDIVQLCYVLPKKYLSLLPKEVYEEIMSKHSDLYVENCEFVWAFCKYFWECHADLPHININTLEQLTRSVKGV